MGKAFLELMARLGYERFGIQGGDTGAFIAPEMGRQSPERVIGIHVNALVTIPSADPADMAALTERERGRLAHHKAFRETGMGYAQIQGTRPQTIAYGLTDSPVAQLAWIVEKFAEWSNPAAALPEDAVSRDRLLTNVMLYWLTLGSLGPPALLPRRTTSAFGIHRCGRHRVLLESSYARSSS